MDKQRLIELGIDEAVADTIMEDINNIVSGLKKEIEDKERQYATNKIIDKYEYISDLSREMAVRELENQNFKLTDGVFEGGSEYMEKFIKDNPYLVKKPTVPTLILGGTGSASGRSDVESEFYNRNPNLRKG